MRQPRIARARPRPRDSPVGPSTIRPYQLAPGRGDTRRQSRRRRQRASSSAATARSPWPLRGHAEEVDELGASGITHATAGERHGQACSKRTRDVVPIADGGVQAFSAPDHALREPVSRNDVICVPLFALCGQRRKWWSGQGRRGRAADHRLRRRRGRPRSKRCRSSARCLRPRRRTRGCARCPLGHDTQEHTAVATGGMPQ